MNSAKLDALIATLDKMIGDNIAADVVAIEETTRALIQEQIQNGIIENLTTNQVAQAVDDVFGGFTEIRALRIARTEIGTSASFGQFASAAQAGMTHKTWRTALDAHVRDSHNHMNGETVPLFDKFSNGGLYPVDSNLPAGERINCRCSMTFSIQG